MEEQSRESVRRMLEQARSDWRGIEFVVYVHPELLERFADEPHVVGSDGDPLLRTFMGSDLRAWDEDMNHPPARHEVHISPFYGRTLPEGIPPYVVTLGAEAVG